ncbi:hypothetical protein [Actinomadura sp. NPDC000600]|uniref:DUF6881 domain-containing protein n=1 Tax=Actinomadura sp. NPDC000600 TaxID=3154262 RepID=UPI0033908927
MTRSSQGRALSSPGALHLEYADQRHEAGATALLGVPVGTVAEIAAQDEFQSSAISERDFEEMWARVGAMREE